MLAELGKKEDTYAKIIVRSVEIHKENNKEAKRNVGFLLSKKHISQGLLS
jgi:hypothetical protein